MKTSVRWSVGALIGTLKWEVSRFLGCRVCLSSGFEGRRGVVEGGDVVGGYVPLPTRPGRYSNSALRRVGATHLVGEGNMRIGLNLENHLLSVTGQV